MDNPKANLQRKGSSIPLESSQILWSSDRSTKDLRSAGGSPGKNDKDKDVNVQVVLRCRWETFDFNNCCLLQKQEHIKCLIFQPKLLCCRPLSEDEKRAKTPVAISCDEHSREVSVIQNVANKYRDKAFVFDNVSSWFCFSF